MKRKVIYIVLSVFLLSVIGFGGYKIYQDQNVDYFSFATQEDINDLLTEEGYEDCADYRKDIFLNQQRDNVHYKALQAISYELGICIEQDIEEALKIYLKIHEDKSLGFHTIRPAVIYGYGPEHLRDKKKADFFFKETIISLAHFTPVKLRNKLLSHSFPNSKLPKEIDIENKWLNNFFQKSTDEKRKIIEELEKIGHKDAGFLLNPFTDFHPIPVPNKENN